MEGATTSSRGFSSGSIPTCGREGEYCECFRIVGYIEENGVRVKPILKYERNEQHCDQEAESEIGSDNGQPPGGSNSGSYTPPDRSEPGSGYQGQDPNDFAPGGGGTPSDTGGPNNDDNDDEQDPDQNNEETDCIELSNGDCAGVVTTSLEPTNICEANLSSLVPGLEDEIACLTSNEDVDMCALNTEVSNYLNSVRDSSGNIPAEEEAFAKSYLDALCENPEVEVDFEDKLIIDGSVPDCLRDIINDFTPENFSGIDFSNLDNQLAQQLSLPSNIMSLFNNSGNYTLQFSVEPSLSNSQGQSVNAQTAPPTANGLVQITFSNAYLTAATDLAIARTLIHELVHTYIFNQINVNPFGNISQSLTQIIEQSGMVSATPQHEFMASQMVDSMAYALQAWHNNPSINLEIYKQMAWSGDMRNSASYIFLDPVFKSDSERRDQAESGVIPSNNSAFPILPQIGQQTCD